MNLSYPDCHGGDEPVLPRNPFFWLDTLLIEGLPSISQRTPCAVLS